MELKVTPYEQPAIIDFNFDELKQELTERVHVYKTAVYDDNQIKQAKADRADLNRLKKALNDERIRREKDYLKPFNEFKDKINEIIKIIDEPVAVIDQQIKEYEDRLKEEKRIAIEEFFINEIKENLATMPPEWLKFDRIFDNRWLNASVSMTGVKKEITDKVTRINEDVQTLQDLPEFGFEAVAVYKDTLDINKALNEARRMSDIQKAKAEAERIAAEKAAQEEQAKQEPTPEPEPVPFEETPAPKEPKMWVEFRAELTTTQAKELKAFFDERGILFEAVRR